MRTESRFRSFAIILALLFGYSGNAQTIDPSFTSGNQYVNQIGRQSTGKIIVVNAFMDSYDGNPAKGIARLNADGTFDPTFFTTTSGFVNSGFAYDRHLLIDNSDRIIVVGQFTSVHGVPRTDIVRFNSDGTVDNFNPRIHVDGPITRALINTSDNKIYISGAFTSYDGVPLSGIARLNPDGSLDTGFNPTTPNYGILAVQNDGKPIALGGPGGVVFTRFNVDGSIDPSFSPALLPPFITIFAGGLGNIAKISPDNKIYFVWLQSIGESMYPSRLNRYNADGTEDTGYTPALGISSFGSITSLDVTESGKVIVCGNEIWSGSNKGVVRLNADGSTDNTFTSPLTSPYAADAVLQPDGNLVLAASFPDGSTLNRLLLPQLAIQSFSPLEGYVNTTVTITGTGFDPTASNNVVKLNGTPAVVSAPNTSTTLTITVPAGATSGPISVTSGGVTVTSMQDFTVTPSDCTTPPPGNACFLDGLNDVITTAVNDYANVYPSTTIEAWVYPLRINHLQTQVIVSGSRGIIIPGGTSNFGVYTGSDIWMPVEATPNQWQHVAVVYTSDNIYFYKNGVEFVYGATPTTNFGSWLSIGGEEGWGVGFHGKIDEVRFWTTQRTLQEINDYRCFALVGTEPNLEAYFKLDEAGQGQGIEVLNSSTRMTGNGITYGTTTTPFFTDILSSGSCVPLSERNALIALYNATDGPNWGVANQNWLSPDESTWFGVTVRGCHITGVKIGNIGTTNMTGVLPIELQNLTELDTLILKGGSSLLSNISGSVIPELGTLTKLRVLELWGQYSGTLPASLGNLTELRMLRILGSHSLTGDIPVELSNLSNLEFLELRGGAFVDLASSGTTGLTGSIPPGVAALPKLRNLWLSENQLTGNIPTTYSPNLSSLQLHGNKLTGTMPASLSNYTSLVALYVHRNNLTGTLPPSLGNLTSLEALNISYNDLSGPIPTEYNTITKLWWFYAQENNLEGEIPSSFGPSMRWLGVQNNRISRIPAFTHPSIGELSVSNNHLDFGDLEPNIGKAGFTYTPQAKLQGGAVSTSVGSTLTVPFTVGGTQNVYQWYKDGAPVVGETSMQFTKANAQLTDAGSYHVVITNTLVTGLTLTSEPFIVSVTACTPPAPPTAPSINRCGTGTVALSATGATGTQEYRWYDAASGGSSLSSTSTFTTPTLTLTTSYYVSVFDIATSCESSRTQIDAIVNTPPAAPSAISNSGCSGTSISIVASGGTNGQYRWYTAASGGTPDTQQNATFNTPALTNTTSFWVAINNGTCESARTEVIGTVLPLPTSPIVQPVNPVCPGSEITLTATGGADGQYRWYDGATIISGAVNSTLAVANLTSAKTFSASIHDGTCESNKTSIVASIKSCTAPSVESTVATAFVNGIVAINLENLISDPESDLDPASLQIIEQPQSGASATLEGFNLNIDYSGIAFSGTDRVTVGICDLTNLCTEQAVTIELGGQIKIYNAVSPNGDGKNEIFFIQYIELLPETQRNTVSIYNRWGDEVFQTKNYNNTSNVFKGESNTGDKLPSGTYFYKIIFASGKSRTGFLELKR